MVLWCCSNDTTPDPCPDAPRQPCHGGARECLSSRHGLGGPIWDFSPQRTLLLAVDCQGPIDDPPEPLPVVRASATSFPTSTHKFMYRGNSPTPPPPPTTSPCPRFPPLSKSSHDCITLSRELPSPLLCGSRLIKLLDVEVSRDRRHHVSSCLRQAHPLGSLFAGTGACGCIESRASPPSLSFAGTWGRSAQAWR
jgi:hypothetical protein